MNKSGKDLTQALYFVYDLSERLGVNFFLLKDTGKQVIDRKPLDGDIDFGAREAEFTPNRLRDLQLIFKREHIEPEYTERGIDFEYKGAKMHLHIIKGKYRFFKNMTLAFHNAFEFWMPNPYSGYYKARNLIK